MDFLQEELDEIMNIFRAESEEIIRRMNTNLLLLEKKTQDKEIIMHLFRDAHSLKGASRMVGFNNLQKLAHKIEDLLDFANTDKIVVNSDFISLLCQVLDYILQQIIVSVDQKEEVVTDKLEELLNKLQDTLDNPSSEILIDTQTFNNCDELSQEQKLNITESLTEIYSFCEDLNCNPDLLLDSFSKLANLFDERVSAEINKLVSETIGTIKFIKQASGFFTAEELDNLKNTVKKILSLIQKVENTEIMQSQTNSDNIENCSFDDVFELLDKFENDVSIKKTLYEKLQAINNSFPEDNIQQVFQNIINLLEGFSKSDKKSNHDVILLIKECLRDTKKALSKKEIQPLQTEHILQRLLIANQVVDFNLPVKNKYSNQIVSKNNYQGSNEFLKNFENISIKTLRVDTKKLDKLVNQMSELIVSHIKIQDHLKELKSVKTEIQELGDLFQKFNKLKNEQNSKAVITPLNNIVETASEKITDIKSKIGVLFESFTDDHQYYNQTIDEMEEMIKNIRVLPIATIFHIFPRMVRDIAKTEDKEVEILISGGETCVDKKIIEEIKSPLIHIIRNSIDHGIEHPDEREKMGKSRVGKIQISAKNSSNKIIIEIKDDGRGINLEKIKMKALARGILSESEINNLTNEQIMNIIFLPGFSTGDEITDISGRGVGLDVVQTKITQLDGKVKINSLLGQGATVTIELPVSMATVKSFIVECSKQFYAIPIMAINSVIFLNGSDIFLKDNFKTFLHNNVPIRIFHLDEILNVQHNTIVENKKYLVLIIESDNNSIGLIIDRIEGDQEILQKKFAPPIFRLKNILGLTTLTSGRICFILNISDIFKIATGSTNILPTKTPEEMKRFLSKKENSDYNVLFLTNEENAEMALPQLQKEGYSLKIVNKNTDFFESLRRQFFDLITIMLPANTNESIEIIKQLKTNELFANIPTLIIGANITNELQDYLAMYHVEDFLSLENFAHDKYMYKVKRLLKQL